jgi:KH domain-containing protein
MEIFSSETIRKISKNKKLLEKKLKVKIEINDSEVNLKGKEIDVYVGEKVLEAIARNFSINTALLLLSEDYVLEDIPIRTVTKKKNLENIKARIIGTKGKTLKVLSELSNCNITLHNNTVSIIGRGEDVKEATVAIKRLILGSKQSNVYSYLERNRSREEENLGLKQ